MGYENGKIYRICCNVSGKQYIGSTTQRLSKRLSQHKKDFKLWVEGKCDYVKSYEVIENGDYDIILIEAYPCESKYELERRERHYIETMECVNLRRPALTQEERFDYKRCINRQYREENWLKINELRKQKYECECGGKYTHINKAQHFKSKKHQHWEQYYQENKENIKELMKQHYQANKDKMNEKRKRQFDCGCGGKFIYSHKANHYKTKKHQDWEQQQTTRNQP